MQWIISTTTQASPYNPGQGAAPERLLAARRCVGPWHAGKWLSPLRGQRAVSELGWGSCWASLLKDGDRGHDTWRFRARLDGPLSPSLGRKRRGCVCPSHLRASNKLSRRAA